MSTFIGAGEKIINTDNIVFINMDHNGAVEIWTIGNFELEPDIKFVDWEARSFRTVWERNIITLRTAT